MLSFSLQLDSLPLTLGALGTTGITRQTALRLVKDLLVADLNKVLTQSQTLLSLEADDALELAANAVNVHLRIEEDCSDASSAPSGRRLLSPSDAVWISGSAAHAVSFDIAKQIRDQIVDPDSSLRTTGVLGRYVDANVFPRVVEPAEVQGTRAPTKSPTTPGQTPVVNTTETPSAPGSTPTPASDVSNFFGLLMSPRDVILAWAITGSLVLCCLLTICYKCRAKEPAGRKFRDSQRKLEMMEREIARKKSDKNLKKKVDHRAKARAAESSSDSGDESPIPIVKRPAKKVERRDSTDEDEAPPEYSPPADAKRGAKAPLRRKLSLDFDDI